MIFQTPIMALLLVSLLASIVAVWSGWFGLRVLARWNLASGSRAQLQMERLTELVSTLFRFVMLAELVALVLFVFNADRMATLFVGAMCAVGTLNVNPYGFPALYAKIAVFFAAAVWLMLDRADRMGRDFPLTRVKYGALVGIAPLVVLSAGLELTYFLNLRTDVITSCCSKLFTPVNPNLAADLSSLSPGMALGLLAAAGGFALVSGAASLIWRRGTQVFALAGVVLFGVAITAIISVVSSYIYEHPNHHCPFCILKPEYGYFGYALYGPLFAGTALAMAAGVLQGFSRVPSLTGVLPALIRRQIVLSLVAFALFGVAVVWAILRSQLILFG
ncbi:MAG: hypothetical protein PHX82_11140 [Paracoccaceae bacterium]|jgi:hypothetical protein|nr:hypothetical protein [Paracoccaceae bacterium]